jgi:F-type H+-transporting ATPase subunit delta
MAQAITLARPYARAASLAFAAAVAGDALVADLGNDPRVLPAQLAALHLPAGVAVDAPFGQFLTEMAEQRRLVLLPEVLQLFEMLKRESESQLLVKVTSAMTLDAAQSEQLKASLKRRFKREIELETSVDASLLAGVVIDTGTEVIDGSARGRLAQLAGALSH